MNISQLLEMLKQPGAVSTVGSKFIAGIFVALLSMAVVFILLSIISILMSSIQREKSKKENQIILEIQNPEDIINRKNKALNETNEDMNNEQLVAVITAAICAASGKNSNSFLVRKISRTNNNISTWENMSNNKSGRNK